MTSLRLEFGPGSPHHFLASLDGEIESCVSFGRAPLSLPGVEGLLESWCWLVLPAVCDEVLEAFFLGVGMGVRKEWGPATLLRIEREAQMCMMQFLSLYNNSVNLKYEVSLWFFLSLTRKARKFRMQGNTAGADWDLEDQWLRLVSLYVERNEAYRAKTCVVQARLEEDLRAYCLLWMGELCHIGWSFSVWTTWWGSPTSP